MRKTNPSGVELLIEYDDVDLMGIDEEEESVPGLDSNTNGLNSDEELDNVLLLEEDDLGFDSKTNGLKADEELDNVLDILVETELETSLSFTEEEEDEPGLEGMTNTNPSGVELLIEKEDANLDGIDEEVRGGVNEKLEDAPEKDTLGLEGITNINPSGAELLIETDEEEGFEANVNIVSVEDDEQEEDEPPFDSKVNGLKAEIELDNALL